MCVALIASGLIAPALDAQPAASVLRPVVDWTLDSLTRVGGHPVATEGRPQVVRTPIGPAIAFNGHSDALVLDVNPIAALPRFTIEAIIDPAPDGGPEQRFLHIEEVGTGNRALLETRVLPDALWCLDSFLKSGDAALTLIDRTAAHRTGEWHAVALTFDGTTMTHYVDGVREASGRVAFTPLGPGRMSLGVRLNRVSWFKGRIHRVRVTPDALAPSALVSVPTARPATVRLGSLPSPLRQPARSRARPSHARQSTSDRPYTSLVTLPRGSRS